MSKRSSTNAKNFAGISWGFGVRNNKNSQKQEKKIKEKESRLNEQWKRLCKKFGLVINTENKSKYENLQLRFNENRQLKLKSLKNVDCFRIYCQLNKEDFSLQNYFDSQMNTFDYKKKLPEIYLKSKEKKSRPKRTESKSKEGVFKKLAKSTNTVMNNLSDEIIKKLEKIKNGL